MPKKRVVLIMAVTSWLAACKTPPAPPPALPAPIAPPEVKDDAARIISTTDRQQAQKMARDVVGMLENGNEEQARAELQRALGLDPNNELARKLLKQISLDPQAVAGTEWFTYPVQRGEQLSELAQRFLGDKYRFYELARYNGIKVPRLLSVGQVLRIPGRPPVKEPPPETSKPPRADNDEGRPAFLEAQALENTDPLRALSLYELASESVYPGAYDKAALLRKSLVKQYTAEAHRATSHQDLAKAIEYWRLVLRIDPGNRKAELELREAQRLHAIFKSIR
jgi:tetratricopeptide (TPR) repeat protein